MRLVIRGSPRNPWGQLEADTPEEMAALEACAARGEWTNGRGEEAITTLRALAERLGYPVGTAERRVPPSLVVVQRDQPAVYERLTAMERSAATVIVDRRQGERRTTIDPAVTDRRQQSRRVPPPATWDVLGFLVARPPGAPLLSGHRRG